MQCANAEYEKKGIKAGFEKDAKRNSEMDDIILFVVFFFF